MPNAPSNFAINPYTAQLEDIERRRAYAQALQQQGMQPMSDTQMAGGWAIPRSPMEGVGKIAQSIAGAYGQKQATEAQKQLADKYQADMGSTLARALRAGTGSPERPATLDPQESEQMADQGTAAPPNIPAQAPDRAAMASILMQHPGTQQIGMQQMVADMQRQAMVSALKGGQAAPQPQPTAQMGGQVDLANSPPPAATAPAAAPVATGGPAGGISMEAWIQADPTGKSYMEQLAKDNEAANKPVISRGYGVGRMVNGQYVPDPASLGQIRDVEQVKRDVGQPYSTQTVDVPVWLPGGDQTTVKLNAMQALEYNRTGKLPPEIAASIPGLNQGAPAPAGGPVNNPGNLRPPGASTGFQKFGSPQEGLAAIDKNLQAYATKGVNTLEGVISRWAPPSENNTAAYIADAAKRLGVDPKQPIDLNNPAVRQAVGTAIMLHEQGPQKLFGAPGPRPVVGRTQTQNEQVTQTGQTAEAKKTGEQLGDYSTTVMNDAAKAAVSNRYLDNMELAAKDISLGKLAPAQSALVQWAQAAGLPVPAEARKAAGSTQALASMAIKMAGQATRQSDAQPSQLQYFKMLESMPDIGRSPEGFSRIVAYLRDANNYNVAKMQHLQQWRQGHNGTAAGFEAAWPKLADQLPFVWNTSGKTPQSATLTGSNPSIDDLVNHYVKSR